MPTAVDAGIEARVISRLMWRLMPFLFLLYIVAYLDRINVSFAILQMRGQLQLSDRAYGRAAGIFFAGYFFFQLPSNLLLVRVGVRRWITGLMVTWGLVSCSMIFIRGPVSFYTLRFLLGVAEAGFFPGMILYLRQWFPASARARAVAWFMTANPLAGVVGSPISGALLGLRGGGLAGWQWLFLMEGLPAIVLGAAVYWVLTDCPENASWLAEPERSWLVETLAREQQELPHEGSIRKKEGIWAVLSSARTWLLSVIFFGVATCMYGVTLWLPTVIRTLSHLSYFETGVVAAIPYVIAAVVMVTAGMSSDRTGERRWHTALPAFAGAAALAVAAYSSAAALVIGGIGLGMIGAEAMLGPFWAMATARLRGTSAAAGIAVINSIGNLGGYFGPYIIGRASSLGGGFRGGLLAIGATLALSGAIAAVLGRGTRRVEGVE